MHYAPDVVLWLDYVRVYHRWPRWARSEGFIHKTRLKMLYDRRPILKIFADKWSVRDYVESKLGSGECLARAWGPIYSASEISTFDIPAPSVMKANHGSGMVRVIERADAEIRSELVALAQSWLGTDYSEQFGEFAYRDLERCIFFEELLLDADGRLPDDVKIWCFHGVPKLVQIDRDRFDNHRQNFYDVDFNRLPIRYRSPNFEHPIERPAHWDQMLAIAATLSGDTDFVRVDLYDLPDRVVFGELTNYPNAGEVGFEPVEWDMRIGREWNYSRSYYRRGVRG